MPQSYDLEDIALTLEHLKNQRSGPPVLVQPAVPSQPSWWSQLFQGGAGWITLLVLAMGGLISNSVSIANLQYKAETSITDRAALHTQLDNKISKDNDWQMDMRSNFTELKTLVKQLVDQREINNATRK